MGSFKRHVGARTEQHLLAAFFMLLVSLSFNAISTEVLFGDEPKVSESRPRIRIKGRVIYPDGRPVAQAKVSARSSCIDPGSPYRVSWVETALTNQDGSFSLELFDRRCNSVLFTASKREEFWLETGENSLYEKPNGTSPLIEIDATASPPFVTIQLGFRGGEAEVSVWDKATRSYIEAGLVIMRPSSGNDKVYPLIYVSTGTHGQSHGLLLPEGQYKIGLNYFYCHGKKYFAKDFAPEELEVVQAERREKELRVDITKVDVRSSSDNLFGEKCQL